MISRLYWLIVDQESTSMRVLTIDLFTRSEALAVFSFEEEARMYLCLRSGGPEWGVRQTSAGELISVLCGPCAQAKRVVLDPLAEPGGETLAGLLSLDRDRFVQTLVGAARSYTQPAWARSEASLKPIIGVA